MRSGANYQAYAVNLEKDHLAHLLLRAPTFGRDST
jgi:hypothetical protein